MRQICTIDGCEGLVNGHGLCGKHYARARKHGSPLGGSHNHATLYERLWRQVSKQSGCWLWTGNTSPIGYGRIQSGGKGSKHLSAHRVAFEAANGPIPPGLVVMHSCDNRRCCNPAHLSRGTHKQNTADMIAKGRHARKAPLGEASGVAVLTEEIVRVIRASNERTADLARRFGAAPNTIRAVRTGRTWTHVT